MYDLIMDMSGGVLLRQNYSMAYEIGKKTEYCGNNTEPIVNSRIKP